MYKFEIGVGFVMLVIFIYECGEALWAHELAGAILCGGLAALVILGFMNAWGFEQERKMGVQTPNQR